MTIETTYLTKRYGNTLAVDDLSFTVAIGYAAAMFALATGVLTRRDA